MKKTTILFSVACISAFNTIQSEQKLDLKEKCGFLDNLEPNTLSEAVRQIKWRIRSGYLAELNYDLNGIRWLVKKLAEAFNVKTTTIALKIGSPAANQYVKFTRRYLEILLEYGEDEARRYSHLYPQFNADLNRKDHE